MERVFQKTQVLGATTNDRLNGLFRQKVQLEDQLKDVESQIHYARGVLDSLAELQTFIRDLGHSDEAEDDLATDYLPPVAEKGFGNNGHEEVRQGAVKNES